MENFSAEVLRREFAEMDTDGSGSLDTDELLAVFNRLGKEVKRGTIANLVRLADEDGNGTIEWDEFAKIFEVVARLADGKQDSTTPNQSPPVSSPDPIQMPPPA